MSIVYDFRLPDQTSPVYVIVSAGGMAYSSWPRSEKDTPYLMQKPPLNKEHTEVLNKMFGRSWRGETGAGDGETVWGQPIFRLDSEAWRDRMVPERVHCAWGPKTDMGDRVLEVTKTGPEHPSVGGNWTAGWVKPDRKHYPQLGRRAIKWCLDGITQRYFALGPMTRSDAEQIQRDKGPAGIAIVSRAELESAFSHPGSWDGIHTDG